MLLNRFWKDRRGGVAPMLALLAFPIVGVVGAGVDYSRANAARSSMQNAVDSTALMIAKSAATLTPAQVQSQASTYFNAVFNRTDVKNLSVTVSYAAQGGSVVTVNSAGTINTMFMGLIGYSTLDLQAKGVVKWSNSKLRVALALDVTGSMASDGKMTALKTATANLLTQLKNAATADGDVYVSIVPFSKDVNLGASNYDQSWIRWDLWDAANGTCSKSWYTSKNSCTSNAGVWTAKNHNTWNGCVTDRDQNFDTTNDAPMVGATLYPAEQYSSCPTSVIGLTYDWTALNSKVNALSPAGNTNQAIGLQMGWQTLTAAPFTIPPKDSNYNYQEVIILLTDGLNTEDRWYTNASSIDNREQKTCNNIKAAGITLYTVQVNTGGDPTSTLLRNCASTSDKFFLLSSANQIITTFNSIGTSLTKLHLAQ
jgi:Flp pilus assembly protein TadG